MDVQCWKNRDCEVDVAKDLSFVSTRVPDLLVQNSLVSGRQIREQIANLLVSEGVEQIVRHQ